MQNKFAVNFKITNVRLKCEVSGVPIRVFIVNGTVKIGVIQSFILMDLTLTKFASIVRQPIGLSTCWNRVLSFNMSAFMFQKGFSINFLSNGLINMEFIKFLHYSPVF